MNRFLLAALAAASLSGCALTEELAANMENRLACSVARDKLYAVSEYYRWGITSRISDKDAVEVCARPAAK